MIIVLYVVCSVSTSTFPSCMFDNSMMLPSSQSLRLASAFIYLINVSPWLCCLSLCILWGLVLAILNHHYLTFYNVLRLYPRACLDQWNCRKRPRSNFQNGRLGRGFFLDSSVFTNFWRMKEFWEVEGVLFYWLSNVNLLFYVLV